jgi:hypothetical protein
MRGRERTIRRTQVRSPLSVPALPRSVQEVPYRPLVQTFITSSANAAAVESIVPPQKNGARRCVAGGRGAARTCRPGRGPSCTDVGQLRCGAPPIRAGAARQAGGPDNDDALILRHIRAHPVRGARFGALGVALRRDGWRAQGRRSRVQCGSGRRRRRFVEVMRARSVQHSECKFVTFFREGGFAREGRACGVGDAVRAGSLRSRRSSDRDFEVCDVEVALGRCRW